MTRRTDWLLNQLPMGMLDDDFFVRFISMFQEVASTLLADADNIPNTVDVTVAPPELVRYLGSWLGISAIDPSLPEELQRRLVRRASHTLAWRGTRRGLEGFLEVVTGAPAEVEDSGRILRQSIEAPSTNGAVPQAGVERTVTIRVHSLGWLTPEDFVTLVADEIPANVSWSLYLDDRQLWPRPQPASETTLVEALVGAPSGQLTPSGQLSPLSDPAAPGEEPI